MNLGGSGAFSFRRFSFRVIVRPWTPVSKAATVSLEQGSIKRMPHSPVHATDCALEGNSAADNNDQESRTGALQQAKLRERATEHGSIVGHRPPSNISPDAVIQTVEHRPYCMAGIVQGLDSVIVRCRYEGQEEACLRK